MLSTEDFSRLGFWEDSTPEENITVYGMDFAGKYILLTDDLGKTPAAKENTLIVAAYDDADCFLWGKELKNFAALEELAQRCPPESEELYQALQDYSLPR